MNWQPLANLDPQHSEQQHYVFLFPGEDTPLRPAYWKYVVVEIVAWLCDQGYLTPDACPVKRPEDSFRYLVHTKPYHSDDSPFIDCELVRPGIYVETKYNNKRLVENARVIIERVAPQLASKFRFRRTA